MLHIMDLMDILDSMKAWNQIYSIGHFLGWSFEVEAEGHFTIWNFVI